MTADADFKKLVRARMTETGERYTQARAALLAEHEAALRAEETFRARTLRSFLRDGRLVSVPVKRRARVVVLLELLDLFEPGREYPETEVNALLRPVHDDVAYLRRKMVDYGFLARDHGVYRVAEEPKEMAGNMAAEVPIDLAAQLARRGAGS